ncbi:MAG: hypothetical protein WBA07_04225 [Rivularia sp. (in: cyanobacteria)]
MGNISLLSSVWHLLQGFQLTRSYYTILRKVKAAKNNQFKRGLFKMVAISTPAETRTLLEIRWQTFKAMLSDMGSPLTDCRDVKFYVSRRLRVKRTPCTS